MANKIVFTILVVCIGVAVAENVFLRRRDAARQPNVRRGYPSTYPANYPLGWPNNIPTGGDYIPNNGYFPGFDHDPCLDFAYTTIKKYLVFVPSKYNAFSNLYYQCTSNQGATLYMCPFGTTFYGGYCH